MTKLSLHKRLSAAHITSVFLLCLLLFVFSGTGSADISEGTFESITGDEALRIDGEGQDWYESLGWAPSLLELDTSEKGTNSSRKAKLEGSDDASAYLTQEFSAPIAGIADIEWDIYVEEIINIGRRDARDRAGFMIIGDSFWSLTPGPNSDDWERFVVMAFHKNRGGTEGTMTLVAQQVDNDDWTERFTTVYEGLNLGEWHNIKVRCYVEEGEYNVYLNGEVIQEEIAARTGKDSLTHLSFAQLYNGAGTFYVDNVSQTNLYTVRINIEDNRGGFVSNSPAGEPHYYDDDFILFESGTPVTLTPEASPGWKFKEWSGSLTGNDNPATIVMDGDKNITAEFLRAYSLAITTMEGGSVLLSPEEGPYFYGTTVLLRAQPDEGWAFTGWSGDLESDDNPDTILMDSDKSVTASFQKLTYNLDTEIVSGEGRIVLSPANSPYDHGTEVTLTAVGDVGWEFTGWGGDLSGTTNPVTIEMNDDKTIAARFSANPSVYTVTFSTDGNGGLDVVNPNQEVVHGASSNPVTAYPAEGYQFYSWSGDYSGDENPLTLSNVTSDMTIIANFVPSLDANNDNIPDAVQDHIQSLAIDDRQSVTLEFPEHVEVTDCSLIANPSPEAMPAGYSFEYGFFNFTIEGLAPGEAAVVTIYLPDGAEPATYYKYGPTPDNTTPHWYSFMYDGLTGAVINENVITLHFIDGRRGDDDLTANGIIDDDGGPGFTASISIHGESSGESQGATGGCFIGTSS